MTVTTDTPPDWFIRAIAVRPDHREVLFDGVRIHYRSWGPVDAPAVVLVHGGGAHSGWWDHVAPGLEGYRVVAVDLSGHGDSEWRSVYEMRLWGREIAAVVAAEGLSRPVVMGHSMGGWAAVTSSVLHPDMFAAVAFMDSPLNEPLDEQQILLRRRPHHVYASRDEAVARFVARPAQQVFLPFVREHIVQESLRRAEGGWTWKFDVRYFGCRLPFRHLLRALTRPAALLYSEHGLVGRTMAMEMCRLCPSALSVVEVPGAGHHPMLDQPLVLITALRTLLATWESLGLGPGAPCR